MTHDEQLLQTIARQSHLKPAQSAPRVSDYVSALPDYLKLVGTRQRPTRHHDPLAVEMIRQRLSLEEIGQRAFGSATSSDFYGALATGLSVVLAGGYASAGSLDSVLRTIEAANFRAVDFPELAASEPVEIQEDADPPLMRVYAPANAPTGSLRSIASAFKVTRKAMVGLPEALSIFVQRLGVAMLRAEHKRLATVLEASNGLPSGDLFDSSNSVSSASANDVGIGKVLAALRTQTDSAGELSGCGLGAVICPPALEGGLLKARVDLDMTFSVLSLPWLSSVTTWFGLAPKDQASPIVRLILKGSSGQQRIDYATLGTGEARSRAFVASHDFELVPVSRLGVVRASL